MSIFIRATEDKDHGAVSAFLTERWTSPEILIDGEMIDGSRLPGFLAWSNEELVGMVTLIKRPGEWEILTLDSLKRWAGTGTLLLNAVSVSAREAGVKRLMVRTSNDNLDAFRFYQRRGFRFEKVVQGVIDKERILKPEIPLTGDYGIPIRDEIVFSRET